MMNSKRSKIKWSFFVFFLPVFLWLMLLFVIPNVELFRLSFLVMDDEGGMTFSLMNYAAFFEDPVYWLTFARTTGYSLILTFLVLIIALPVAFYITKIATIRTSGLLMVLILVPFWVSEIVRVYGLMLLLRESGIINSFLVWVGVLNEPIEMLYNDVSMIMGLIYTTILFMIVPIVGVMDSLDNSLIEAAYDLGARKKDIWRSGKHRKQ